MLDDRYGTKYVDQRRFLKKMMNDGLRWFGLRSADLSRQCSCKGQPNPKGPCRRCLATNFAFTDYLIKGYLWNNSRAVEFSDAPGPTSTNTLYFLSLPNYPIKKWDILLELDADTESDTPRQPFKIMKFYIISSAEPERGKDGRIELYRALLEERMLNDYEAII